MSSTGGNLQQSSLTQMFDPMIYSQELLLKQQQLDQYLQRNAGEEFGGDLEGLEDSCSTGVPSDVLSAAAIFRRDEHDSASRKTSTASDYTFSSSDYTPENTIVDGMDDQPVQEIILIQSPPAATNTLTSSVQQQPQTTIATTAQPDSPQSEPKTTPQRKISRFYVSPVNLNIPQQQIITMDTNLTIQKTVEMSETAKGTGDNVVPPAATAKDSDPTAVLGEAVLGGDQQMNVVQSQSARSSSGPEQMNTLEQLKIGLENITHAHVNAAQQQQVNAAPMAGASTGPVVNVGPKVSNVVPPQNIVSNVASHQSVSVPSGVLTVDISAVPGIASASSGTTAGSSVVGGSCSVGGAVVLGGGAGCNVSVGLVNVIGAMPNTVAVPVVLPSVPSASSINNNQPANIIVVDGGCLSQSVVSPPMSSASSSSAHPVAGQALPVGIMPAQSLPPSVSVQSQPKAFSSAPNPVLNVNASNVVYSNPALFQQLPLGLVPSQQLIQQQPLVVQEKTSTQQHNSGTNNSSNSVSQTSSVLHSRRTSADVLTNATLLEHSHGLAVADSQHHPISADQVRAIRKYSSEERSMSL